MRLEMRAIEEIRRDWENQQDQSFKMLVDGEWVDAVSGKSFSCVDPYTEQSWGRVPLGGAEDVDAAVNAARRAFDKGGWPQTLPAQRAALLRKLAALIEQNVETLALAQIRENGKLVGEMRMGAQVLAGDCYYFAGLAETMHGYTVQPSAPNFAAYTRREAIGVVAAITPWNSPLGLLAWKLFPALAAGNTIVIKPSEVTPTSTLLLAELIVQAGFPKGVVNVVTGYGRGAGDALVAHPGVDKIAFTGSTPTGSAIARVAADRHARVSLELGGKSPNIIFSDANLDAATMGIVGGIFAATGQTCMAGSRVLVQASIYDEVTERLAKKAKSMRMGDPLDIATELGPLASRAQLEKVCSYFDIGKQDGHLVIAGAQRPDRTGFFVEPTVFGGVSNTDRIAREEIFGPVASLIRFEDEEDAVAIANDTPFGLAAGVWTQNVGRAHRMIERVRAGVVWINTYRMGGRSIPFGGMKMSGQGREVGIDALDAYTEVKSVWINMA
jgi:acyl-CoA reductase-like NAD-dependent aldehyde dehydrogenase